MSLCDIWADAGLRVGKLRDPRAFALMGSPLCMSHIGYPPWGELRGSHIPPVPSYHREVGSVLRGWLACWLGGWPVWKQAYSCPFSPPLKAALAVALTKLSVTPMSSLVISPHPKSWPGKVFLSL